jgi:hypothetical protein
MNKAHLLSNPMVVRSLDGKKDFLRSREDNEELLVRTIFPCNW